MKKIMSLFIVLCFLLLCSCSHLALAGDKQPVIAEKATVEVVLKKALKDWQVKYYTEHLRSIALEYTGLCFKDKRYIKANQELERLTKEKSE